MTKTPGQLAYEKNVRERRIYHDGTPRKTWEQLPDVAQDAWERRSRPAPQPEETGGADDCMHPSHGQRP